MAFTCTWTDPQPASDGRGLTGDQGAWSMWTGGMVSQETPSVVVMKVFDYQVRIPSKSDKPGGSPVRQMAREVWNRK